jgi:hypothetical protein
MLLLDDAHEAMIRKPHAENAVEWIDLPNLGELKSRTEIETLRREFRRSFVMRAEVSVSAIHQVVSRIAAQNGHGIPVEEVVRILSVVGGML